MISSFKALHQLVKGATPKRVALVAAEDPILIQAATRAQQEGLARFILFGDSRKIESLIPPGATRFEIVDSQNPAVDAIKYIHADKADLLMKGKIQTGDLQCDLNHQWHNRQDGVQIMDSLQQANII